MSSTQKVLMFGVKALYVRGSDGIEEQLKALQDASVNLKCSVAELRGDDALDPIALAVSKRDMKVSGKYGQISTKGLQLINGGTLTSIASGNQVTPPEAETAGTTMRDALTVVGGSSNMVTDEFIFTALSSNTYQVVRGSTGAVSGPFTTSGTPRTDVIPGCTVTVAVSPALNAGDVAGVFCTGPSGMVDYLEMTANDIPGTCALRIVTEYQSGLGQFQIELFKCQSTGTTLPIKHKEFGLADFEFQVLWNESIDKTIRITRMK